VLAKEATNINFIIFAICSVGQRQQEDRQTENEKGNHFDMNHLID
jgi:hypothetical protein